MYKHYWAMGQSGKEGYQLNNSKEQVFFKKNYEYYAESKSHELGNDLSLLVDHLPRNGAYTALDIAAGTGFTSFRLSSIYRTVVALDTTIEMLEKAREMALKKNLNNVIFVIGKAEKIPFLDHTFDVVTCRRAAHHFPDKRAFLSEARRVLRPGGYLGFADMILPKLDTDASFNTLERIRDPTHVSAETQGFWEESLSEAGFKISYMQTLPERIGFEEWLSPVKADEDNGIKCKAFIESSDSLKKAISYDSGTFIKTRLVLTAISS